MGRSTHVNGDAFGEHATSAAETLAEGRGIAILKGSNHLKEHAKCGRGEHSITAAALGTAYVMAVIDPKCGKVYKRVLCAGGAVASERYIRRYEFSDTAKHSTPKFMSCVEACSELRWAP